MTAITSFDEARSKLEEFVPPVRSMREAYTLGRMSKLMEVIGNPERKLRVIHVAGTSGKTSTCYYIAALLQQAGCKTGLTVSPHIDEVNERVQINLKPLPEKTFCKELTIFLRVVEKSGLKPTYFEVLVAFAYWEFARRGVDYAVVEVGLGGLLDGTNVAKRADKICVITDIGLDHTEVLGRSAAEIAAQKAGIVQPHNTALMYQQDDMVMDVVRDVCDQQQAELHELLPPQQNELPKNLPLFQRRNWYLAKKTYEFVMERESLPHLSNLTLASSTRTYIPARMEIIAKAHKTLILDGAHNAQKLKTLVRSIRNKYPKQKCTVLLSIVQSKNFRIRTSLEALLPVTTHLIITTFATQQDMRKVSVNPKKVAEYCRELGFENVETVTDPKEAYKALLKRKEKLLLITGSFYLLNHIRPLIFRKKYR